MAEAPAPDPYSTAKANLRDTIKWLATSLAAVGAAVIAGASINGLAALEGRTLVVAAILGGVGLLSILISIAVMVRLLTSNVFYFSDLTKDGNEIAKQINDHASDILSPQTETIAELVEARRRAVEVMRANPSPTAPAYAAAYLEYSGANASIARVTNLAQFLKLRADFRKCEGGLFSLAVLTILTLGGYAVLVGGKATPGEVLAQKVRFNPGAGWTNAATSLAASCGTDPLNGVLVTKKTFEGWVTVKLAPGGRCGGLELTVPAPLVQMAGSAP